MAKQPSRLVVVSARAPFVREEAGISRAPGGLVSVLLPLMRWSGGTWIAAGNEQDAWGSGDAGFRVVAASIPTELRAAWYADASTSALWPLAHGFIERCRFRDDAMRAYREVNRRIAELAAAHAPLRGTVWIHDYQLALVPQFVRALRPDLTVGFFWHVPWPSAEFFRALPWRHQLVAGILGADVVGLHVPRYLEAFAEALRTLGFSYDIEGSELVVQQQNHVCRVVACPVGIDAAAWSALGQDTDVQAKARSLRVDLSGSRLLLAVDRFDYVKGIVERLEAFERLLEGSVDARERATFVQIAVPSRDQVPAYRELRSRVEATVGRILGRFGTPIRHPVHLFVRSFESAELAAFYQAADVAIVTPLRDGLNLVACEYVATQQLPRGRLLLSEMAGVADVLEGAWFVNPYDPDALHAALSSATLAPETDADRTRMDRLRQKVFEMSLDHWTSKFLQHFELAERNAFEDVPRREGAPRSKSSKSINLDEGSCQQEPQTLEKLRRHVG